jgi:5'-AMP-activated protein kinase catalytic alpha subunit
MEYAEGGELFDYIIKKDHLSEEETRNIFHQIIDAIDYMHQMGICHRDLKPENILFDSSHKRIKIIDFGLSNLYYTNDNNEINNDKDNNDENNYEYLENDLLETPCGSPGYAPPEMVLGYSYNGLLTDLWSSGIILYAMLCGSFPFDDDSEQILYSKIIKGIFEFPEDIILTDEAKNLVKKILVVNPNHRATINEIKNDPWFKKDYKPIYGLFLPIQEIPIDNSIIKEMEKKGYKKEEIIKNIKNNRHNEITTFYYLLVKKFNRNGIDTINDLISPCFSKYSLEQNEKIKN